MDQLPSRWRKCQGWSIWGKGRGIQGQAGLTCAPAVQSAPAWNLLHHAITLPLPSSSITFKIIFTLCKSEPGLTEVFSAPAFPERHCGIEGLSGLILKFCHYYPSLKPMGALQCASLLVHVNAPGNRQPV